MIIVPIEISARHVHLCASDWHRLFRGEEPTMARMISQPPQFVAHERVSVSGPKGTLGNLGIVGPLRTYTQVELAASDARLLGITPPLRDSGHLSGASTLTIAGPEGSIQVAAAILQQRHIHCSPAEAQRYHVRDGQEVSVRVVGPRGGTFDHVLIRVHADYHWSMHIDTDEANSFGLAGGGKGEVLR